MKNVLLILSMLMGLAVQNLDAQKCCLPCPPGCCVSSCLSGKSSAASVATPQSGEVTLASLMLGMEDPNCSTMMSKKEMKSCLASCKASAQVAPADNTHTADAVSGNLTGQNTFGITPACQAVCKPSACKGNSSASVAETAQQARIKEKS